MSNNKYPGPLLQRRVGTTEGKMMEHDGTDGVRIIIGIAQTWSTLFYSKLQEPETVNLTTEPQRRIHWGLRFDSIINM